MAAFSIGRLVPKHDWSSYAQTAGLREEAEWLEVDWTLAQFGTTRAEAQRRFRDFVSEGDHARYRPWDELRGRGYLGTGRFAERLAAEARQVRISPEVPRSQCFLAERPDLALVEREVRKVFDAKPMDLAYPCSRPAQHHAESVPQSSFGRLPGLINRSRSRGRRTGRERRVPVSRNLREI